MRILIVEDDCVYLAMLEDYFQSRGYSVTTADNGEQGRELFFESPEAFDAVLTDNMMPKMNGTELIKKIRGNGFTVPIVILSGDEDIDKQEHVANDVFEILEKPIRLRDLGKVFKNIESNITQQSEKMALTL